MISVKIKDVTNPNYINSDKELILCVIVSVPESFITYSNLNTDGNHVVRCLRIYTRNKSILDDSRVDNLIIIYVVSS